MNLTAFEVAAGPVGGAQPEDGWLPAVVPGGVHESLLAAQRIEDPFVDRNEDSVRWIEERDWWFRTRLPRIDSAAGERVRLVFDGLDTVVDIWLDGAPLGHHENMFRPAVFDVTGRAGELVLRFSPPLQGLEPPQSSLDLLGRLGELFAALTEEDDGEQGGLMSEALPLVPIRRKAALSWGWDFGPRVPSIGIWRPVHLLHEHRAVIAHHQVATESIEQSHAVLNVKVGIDAFAAAGRLEVDVTLTAPSGRRWDLTLPVHHGAATGRIIVDDPELWWTHDLGDPALHDVRIVLRDDDVLHTVTDRIGIRTIALDRSPDEEEGGRLFRFVLNGIPLFARGGAWLPPSMLVGSISAERRRALVDLAASGGMNMLRVWGGGVYEEDAFYDACDRAGVLVWQDFAFACIDYPTDDASLRNEVALEAEYQVRRLRNHASLALWSGNNEVLFIHGIAFGGTDPGDWGSEFFFRMLPEIVDRLDGRTPYWPGSPWGEDETEGFGAVNGTRDGDRHAWEVWHGLDFGAGGGEFANPGEARLYRRYAADRGRFISEFGIHAAPEIGTLERWIPADELQIHSPSFDAHNKDHPKNKHDAILDIVTGLPETVEEYVDATMVSQAEGLKFGIEHYRRRQPHCSGTLIWQFNDVWPGFSWSVVDYDLVPKAGYWYAQRAFAPLLASFRHDGDRLELWFSNAGRATSATATVSLEDFDGTVRGEEHIDVALAQGESRVVWATGFAADPAVLARVRGEGFPTNRMFFGEVKDLPLDGTLEWTVEDLGEGEAVVHVQAHGYAYLVHVPSPAAGLRLSSNYFDLRDGESADIHVSGLTGDLVDALRPRTYQGPSRR